MAKYCIYRDRPISMMTAAQTEGCLEDCGCLIFNVWHKCIGCPNCVEMGDSAAYTASSAGNDMWPNYLKEK